MVPPSVGRVRILHTSDWHVGRTFHGRDLLADQDRVLSALADVVAERGVDVVLIAGDIYDRAVPSADAVQVATRALERIRRAGAEIVAISGNHDSAPRLGAFGSFLSAGGLHLRTATDAIASPVMLADDAGPVAVYGIPYLEPEIVRHRLGVDGRASHQAVLAEAMSRIRADLAGRGGCRSVVLTHAFVVGAVPGGSERSIAVGGVESVTGEIFDGVDYVALGHLHNQQVLDDRMRYSGAPLPYTFTEAGREKGCWLVDLAADGTTQTEWVGLPVVRPLATVRGMLAEVLTGNAHLVDHYLAVDLIDPVRPADPMHRLREVFPHVLSVSWEPPTGADRPIVVAAAADHSDRSVIAAFLADCRGGGPSGPEELLVDRALAAARGGAGAG